MKSLGIDFERLKYPNSGLGQFSLNLATELGRQLSLQQEILWFAKFLVPKDYVGHFGDGVQYIRLNPLLKKIRFSMPHVDLWHCTHQDSAYGPKSAHTPMILTIHDLNFLKEKPPKQALARLRALQKKVNRATALTAVSKFTADEIRRHLNIEGKPIEVVYNGVDLSHLHTPHFTKPPWAPATVFFLALGVITKKKNFHVLVEMMRHFPDFALIIAGPHEGDYAGEIFRLIHQFGLNDRIILPGAVSGPVKSWLYHNCSVFLFPSLLEGFGIPLIEAMSYGKPVVCSNQSSLPEIGGSWAAQWDNFASESMAQVLQNHLQNFALAPQANSQARIQYASTFSWQRAAQKYLRLYGEVF